MYLKLNKKDNDSNIGTILQLYEKYGKNLVKSEDSEKKENDQVMKEENDYISFLTECTNTILILCLTSHYFWGLWGVVQAKHSPIDFDFLNYAKDRLVNGYQFGMKLIDQDAFGKSAL